MSVAARPTPQGRRQAGASRAASDTKGTRRSQAVATPVERMAARPAVPDTNGGQVKGPLRERHEADTGIIIAAVTLAAMGVAMIYSAGASEIARGRVPNTLAPELVWVSLGVVVMLVTSRIDYRFLRLVSVPLFLVAIALLGVVLGPPLLGILVPIETNESARWLSIAGVVRFHPAELAKLALVVYLAHWMARRGSSIGGLRSGTIPFLLIAGSAIGLVALEPDLGTTGVITLTAFTMLFVAGGSIWQLLVMIPVGVVAVGMYIGTSSYQRARWETFLDPWSADPDKAFQTIQGLLALALGGVTGQGIGSSRGPGGLPLPAADNDFVFAMVGQELGLWGGALVIALFAFLAWRGIRIAQRAPDTFGGLLALGVSVCLVYQAFINIAVVLQLVPLTGITLPFVSSGNSSLLVSFAAVGILLSVSRETRQTGDDDDAHPGRRRWHRWPHLPRLGRASGAPASTAGS